MTIILRKINSNTLYVFHSKNDFKKWLQNYIQNISYSNEENEKLQGKILRNSYVTVNDMLDLISGSFKVVRRKGE